MSYDTFGAAILPVWSLGNDGYAASLPVPVLGNAKDDVRNVSGDHASSVLSGMLTCEGEATTAPPRPFLPRDAHSTVSRSGHAQLKYGLEYSSKGDWERWKPDLLRLYKQNGAPAIIRQLRRQGYNVTVKMLRDRLRAWKADPKQRKQASREAVSGKPVRAVSTLSGDVRRRHLLKEIDRWYTVALEGRAEPSHAVKSPDPNLLSKFPDMAVAAFRQGTSTAWKRTRWLADEIAGMDWTLMSPLDLTSLLQNTFMVLGSVRLTRLKQVWAHVVMNKGSHNHPVLQLIRYVLDDVVPVDLEMLAGLSAICEAKIRVYRPVDEQEDEIVRSQVCIAWVYQYVGEYALCEAAIRRYAEPAQDLQAVELDEALQCPVHYMLGRVSRRQKRFARAVHHFRLAQQLQRGKKLYLQITIACGLVQSLVSLGWIGEARESLEQLLLNVQSQSGIEYSPTQDEGQTLLADDRLTFLCQALAGTGGLDHVVERLQKVRLVDQEDDEDDMLRRRQRQRRRRKRNMV